MFYPAIPQDLTCKSELRSPQWWTTEQSGEQVWGMVRGGRERSLDIGNPGASKTAQVDVLAQFHLVVIL